MFIKMDSCLLDKLLRQWHFGLISAQRNLAISEEMGRGFKEK